MLDVEALEQPGDEIAIPTSDALIDLSPCVGHYQEATCTVSPGRRCFESLSHTFCSSSAVTRRSLTHQRLTKGWVYTRPFYIRRNQYGQETCKGHKQYERNVIRAPFSKHGIPAYQSSFLSASFSSSFALPKLGIPYPLSGGGKIPVISRISIFLTSVFRTGKCSLMPLAEP